MRNWFIARAALFVFGQSLACANLSAAVAHASEGSELHPFVEYGPHHVSAFGGWTRVDGENYSTTSIEYEYRLSPLLGIGAVAEHAGGNFDADSYMATLDVHPFTSGLIFQFGVGREFRTVTEESTLTEALDAEAMSDLPVEIDEAVTVARAGVLYEFEFGRFTLAPQVHYDYHHGEANSVVYGLSAGVNF